MKKPINSLCKRRLICKVLAAWKKMWSQITNASNCFQAVYLPTVHPPPPELRIFVVFRFGYLKIPPSSQNWTFLWRTFSLCVDFRQIWLHHLNLCRKRRTGQDVAIRQRHHIITWEESACITLLPSLCNKNTLLHFIHGNHRGNRNFCNRVTEPHKIRLVWPWEFCDDVSIYQADWVGHLGPAGPYTGVDNEYKMALQNYMPQYIIIL